MTLICDYRIYPAWFGEGAAKPIQELAQGTASRMDRRVVSVEITGNGETFRGQFIDFRVTYTSSSKRAEGKTTMEQT